MEVNEEADQTTNDYNTILWQMAMAEYMYEWFWNLTSRHVIYKKQNQHLIELLMGNFPNLQENIQCEMSIIFYVVKSSISLFCVFLGHL